MIYSAVSERQFLRFDECAHTQSKKKSQAFFFAVVEMAEIWESEKLAKRGSCSLSCHRCGNVFSCINVYH